MPTRCRGPLILLTYALAAYGCNNPPKRDDPGRAAGQGASATSSRGTDTLAFHAIGTEPFWSLDIGPSGLRFTTPEDTLGIRFPPVSADASGDTIQWRASAARGSLEARLWPGSCSDGMSDRVWQYHASVRVDTTAYRGCAESRAAQPR